MARLIERSRLGYGFATIRDDELAAEASGVPTLRLKLIATTMSGALMGMAGAPFPYYIAYLHPSSAFGLDYAVNSIAMPLIGGTTSWVGPLIGAILLGTLQQIATVTISSAVNLLIVGVLLVGFVIVAPNGIIGLVQKYFSAGRMSPSAAAASRRAPMRRRPRHDAICSRSTISASASAASSRWKHLLAVRAGRADRPDRPQRLRQEHAGQLHLRHAAERDRARCISTASRSTAATAHQRTRRGLARSFQLPRPFASLSLADNMRIPLLYTVAARGGAHRSTREIEARCVELLREVGLDGKAERLPRDLTQVEMRKLELARAMAAEPKLLIADELMAGLTHSEVEDILTLLHRLNEQGVTIILIEHIMRAVMSFSQRLVVLVSGRKIADGDPNEVMRNPEVERAYLGQ